MNKFDLNAQNDLGFLKKIARSVKKVTSKVASKVLPSSVREVGRKIDRTGINKVAMAVAGAVVAGPALLAGAGKVAGAAKVAGSAIATAAGAAAPTAAKLASSAGTIATTAGKAAPAIMGTINALNTQIADSPDFAGTAQEMQHMGMDAASEWARSGIYKDIATPGVQQAIQPFVQEELQRQGIPRDYAHQVSIQEAGVAANNAVKATAESYAKPALILAAVGIPALFLLAGNRGR